LPCRLPFREIELALRDHIEIRQNIGNLHDVCVFRVHVAQADGMAGLAAFVAWT
jgi:hypothetical protein